MSRDGFSTTFFWGWENRRSSWLPTRRCLKMVNQSHHRDARDQWWHPNQIQKATFCACSGEVRLMSYLLLKKGASKLHDLTFLYENKAKVWNGQGNTVVALVTNMREIFHGKYFALDFFSSSCSKLKCCKLCWHTFFFPKIWRSKALLEPLGSGQKGTIRTLSMQ